VYVPTRLLAPLSRPDSNYIKVELRSCGHASRLKPDQAALRYTCVTISKAGRSAESAGTGWPHCVELPTGAAALVDFTIICLTRIRNFVAISMRGFRKFCHRRKLYPDTPLAHTSAKFGMIGRWSGMKKSCGGRLMHVVCWIEAEQTLIPS